MSTPAYLYQYDLDQACSLLETTSMLDKLLSGLGYSEQQRAQKKGKIARKAYILGRHLLRETLAYHCNLSPESLVLIERTNALPEVPIIQQLGYCFSISHSSSKLVIVISQGSAIGVDIECHKERSYMGIAEHMFHVHEIDKLERTKGNNGDLFYFYWTGREAYSKLLNRGIFNCKPNAFYLDQSMTPEKQEHLGFCYYKHTCLKGMESEKPSERFTLSVASKKKLRIFVIDGLALINDDLLASVFSNEKEYLPKPALVMC